MKTALYILIARKLGAIANCQKTGNEWLSTHEDVLDQMVKAYMPNGSGFDCGTTLDMDSTMDKLIFETEFHHMNANGYYTGWTQHKIIVTPSLQHGFNLRVTGRDKSQIKDYIAACFESALNEEIEH